ncbi:MAG TPA: Hpt domain-containing protein, partial [Methanolinea sp.]|nr:Hpt domain-containing protein [Methanolinea sp.]
MSELDAYRSLYIAESRENHENIVKNLLVLEGEASSEAIAEIFRSAHSLKGMSASMDFKGMERLCHAMEDVFQEIRNGNMAVTHALMDTLLSASDTMEAMLDDIEAGGPGIPDDLDDLVEGLKKWIGLKCDALPKNDTLKSSDTAEGTQSGELISAPGGNAQGLNNYCITLCLSDQCDNRNLRAMIILQNLEELGRLERVVPDRAIVEDGEFDGRFTVEIASDAGIEAIKTVTSSSDVKEAVVEDLKSPAPSPAVIMKSAESPGEREEERRSPQRTEKVEKGREVKNIRVDISRLDVMMNLVEDLVINRGRIT